MTQELTEEEQEEIAKRIAEGNTSGKICHDNINISWELKTNKFHD